MKIDWMQAILAGAVALVLLSFYRAHRKPGFEFNAFDLVMIDGRVDRIAVAFMLVLGVTTWVMVDLQISGRMSEGYMTTYGAMWVMPLVARIVFNKTDLPLGSSLTSTTTVTKETSAKAEQ